MVRMPSGSCESNFGLDCLKFDVEKTQTISPRAKDSQTVAVEIQSKHVVSVERERAPFGAVSVVKLRFELQLCISTACLSKPCISRGRMVSVFI